MTAFVSQMNQFIRSTTYSRPSATFLCSLDDRTTAYDNQYVSSPYRTDLRAASFAKPYRHDKAYGRPRECGRLASLQGISNTLSDQKKNKNNPHNHQPTPNLFSEQNKNKQQKHRELFDAFRLCERMEMV